MTSKVRSTVLVSQKYLASFLVPGVKTNTSWNMNNKVSVHGRVLSRLGSGVEPLSPGIGMGRKMGLRLGSIYF